MKEGGVPFGDPSSLTGSRSRAHLKQDLTVVAGSGSLANRCFDVVQGKNRADVRAKHPLRHQPLNTAEQPNHGPDALPASPVGQPKAFDPFGAQEQPDRRTVQRPPLSWLLISIHNY